MRVLVFVEDAEYILKKKADRRLAGPLFCIFRRASGVAWEGELISRGTSCCVLRKSLGLNKLFELVGHGVDVGVRDNERREETQRMGSGVVKDEALGRLKRREHERGRVDGIVELHRAHKAEAAHLFHVGQGSQALGEVLASSFDALDFALAAQLVEHAVRCGDGQAAAAERGSMVARPERVGHFGTRGACAHGHAAGNAFCHGDDVGRDSIVLEREGGAAAIHAALYLIANHERFVLARQAANRFHILLGARMHAAFALHDLKDYGAHIMIGECCLERCDVILRNVDESAGQRLEGFLLQRLRGGSERRERAAVEAVRDGDDGRAAVAETLRVETRELNGAFIGFCARIREERLPFDAVRLRQWCRPRCPTASRRPRRGARCSNSC